MPTAVAGVRFSLAFVCVSVCLFICTISQKNAAARITKLDTEMYHHESWKLIYFRVTSSKVKVTRHKKTVPTWVYALLRVLAPSRLYCHHKDQTAA